MNLAWAFFVLDPDLMGGYLNAVDRLPAICSCWRGSCVSGHYVGGGLGLGLETDEAIRAAAYSKREEDRRDRLAHQR